MVEIIEDNGQIVVRIGGQEYARYEYGPRHPKPYLYPLRAANGLSLLADAPTDHRHHHGFWVGHGRVQHGSDAQDVDCWLERHNSGRIAARGFDALTSGSERGGWTQACDWIGPDGNVVLKDTRAFTFYDTPIEARYFDFELVLRSPDDQPVTLHQTNEAGLPHIRPAEGLSPRTGGTLTNAEGKRNERETYKQRSAWLDCSGTLGRLVCGIAVFDHPRNPEYPTPWFTRDYGPFTPNFIFFRTAPYIITPDAPLRLRYRVYTHSGDARDGHVAEACEQYRAGIMRSDTA